MGRRPAFTRRFYESLASDGFRCAVQLLIDRTMSTWPWVTTADPLTDRRQSATSNSTALRSGADCGRWRMHDQCPSCRANYQAAEIKFKFATGSLSLSNKRIWRRRLHRESHMSTCRSRCEAGHPCNGIAIFSSETLQSANGSMRLKRRNQASPQAFPFTFAFV